MFWFSRFVWLDSLFTGMFYGKACSRELELT